MAVSVMLVLAGVVGLSVLCACLWLPLGLLPLSAAALLAGLLVDWEGADGNVVEPRSRR